MEPAVVDNYTINFASVHGGELDINSFGGALGVRWDERAKVTIWGGLAYFATFLKTTGLLDRLVKDAPFHYTSPNAPRVRDVVGTAVLAIIAGFRRYCHIDRLRHDTACADMLGLSKIVSDESLRRALKKCPEDELDAWLTRHELEVTEALLQIPYIADIDNTVKPVYGHQEGAEIGYNPQKPGRPSYNYHTFFIGTARIVLGVDVRPGKEHSGKCGMPALWSFIDRLPEKCRPKLVRGDIGYGNEDVMSSAEQRNIKYLFKIKRSRNVCALFKRLESSCEWKDCGSGWEAVDTVIRLDGWTKKRRCVLLRRPAKDEPKTKPEKKKRGRPKKGTLAPVQQEFEFVEDREGRTWDCIALVTNNTELDAMALSQLYRDRGDCENNFDEFKNQWSWSGLVTQKIKPTRAMARLVAIVANWWNVFARLADSDKHMEAITSRPKLLSIVGRIVESGRKKLIHLTSTHIEAPRIRTALERINGFLRAISATAPQLDFNQIWTLILKVAFRKFLAGRPISPISDGAQLLL